MPRAGFLVSLDLGCPSPVWPASDIPARGQESGGGFSLPIQAIPRRMAALSGRGGQDLGTSFPWKSQPIAHCGFHK